MNLERFNAFRRDSDIICQSSAWLTDQIELVVKEMENLPDNCDIDYQKELLDRMDHLQLKAIWEDKEHSRFNEKYRDMLETD